MFYLRHGVPSGASVNARWFSNANTEFAFSGITNPDKYDFFIPDDAAWEYEKENGQLDGIAHLKTAIGSGLNKALAALEDANPDTLQDVLKDQINFNRKVGQRTLDDRTLQEFIGHFNEIPLANDDFEFPDLLGAAYEYLIKYFADSAGKKGGDSIRLLKLSAQWSRPSNLLRA